MSLNVLLVDDSSVVRKVMMRAFGMTNIPVKQFVEAQNGQIGLEKLKSEWIDIVFLDINMPVMNGMEFMQEMLKDENIKDTPVVVVSTEGSKERIDQLQIAGVKAYLRKPVTPEVLVETINNLLGDISHGVK
jgi:two-component system, chemotaxis family, chemotaxis protein CheY